MGEESTGSAVDAVTRNLLERIHERAGQLYFQFGFKRVTMDDIAHRLGMSKKTIYQAIPGKDALIESFVLHMLEKKIVEAEAALDESDDIIEATGHLLHFIRNRMSFISPAMIGDLQRYYPHLWDRINERRLLLLRRYLGQIEQAQQQGLIKDEVNPKIMVRMVEVFVTQVAVPNTIVELDVPLSDVLRTFLTVMLQGALTDEGRAKLEEVKS